MKKICLSIMFMLSVAVVDAQAQNPLGASSKALPASQNAKTEKAEVLPSIRDGISKNALKNITNSELAFCYTVDMAESGYDGYTLDNMKVKGFCGILGQAELDFILNEFLKKEENISSVVANCIIRPRIMLRFINGIDNTDVLLSSPCHSFSVFYAGEIKSFNLAPGAEVVNSVIEAYEKRQINFVSPALLGQVLPVGVPQTEEHRKLIREKTVQKPIKKWEVEKESAEKPQKSESSSGWNRLKVNR